MIQIAVCDDEKYYRDKIRELAAQFLEKRQLPYTVTVYPSGEDFLAGEENLVKYDIVFLDISMKDIDGIETAMRIRSFHSGTCIVFVTAFLDYALDGYKADAVRYLMKDSLGTEMEECMAAVLERMELRQVALPEGYRNYTRIIFFTWRAGNINLFSSAWSQNGRNTSSMRSWM